MTANPTEVLERLRAKLGGDFFLVQEAQGFISYACQRGNGDQIVGLITTAAKDDPEACADAIIEAARPR